MGLWKNIVILMAPFFGAGGPMQLWLAAFVQFGVAIGPPACKERRPSG